MGDACHFYYLVNLHTFTSEIFLQTFFIVITLYTVVKHFFIIPQYKLMVLFNTLLMILLVHGKCCDCWWLEWANENDLRLDVSNRKICKSFRRDHTITQTQYYTQCHNNGKARIEKRNVVTLIIISSYIFTFPFIILISFDQTIPTRIWR